MHSMLEQFLTFYFFGYKNKRSKYEVEKVSIWQHFLRSGKYKNTFFLIFLLCPSQIKIYIITGVVSNFLMHLVIGWHLLCRKENTIWITIWNTVALNKAAWRIYLKVSYYKIKLNKFKMYFTFLQMHSINHVNSIVKNWDSIQVSGKNFATIPKPLLKHKFREKHTAVSPLLFSRYPLF